MCDSRVLDTDKLEAFLVQLCFFAGGIVKIFSKNNEPHSRIIQRPRDLGRQAEFVGMLLSKICIG